MKPEKLRVALIGPGRISVAHLDAITHDPSLATLVSVAGLPHERERSLELAEQFGAERVDDIDAVVAADDIDAVVVTVPNHVHSTVAVPLLDGGKHVLMEKPLANTIDECDTMIDAAKRAERTLMVGQCRRFFTGAQRAKEAIADLGGPLVVNHHLGVYVEHAATDWWRSADAAGGLAVGLNGPHVIDTMLWLVEAQPVGVYAQTRRLRDNWEGEDEAVFVLDFADGSVCTGHISLNAIDPVNDRWVHGPKGSLRLTDDRSLWLNGEAMVQEEVVPYINGDPSFRGQFREFIDSIREGRDPRPSASDGREVVRIIEAIRQSQDSGARVPL